jgi:transcriptional regulator with XRE-family HTH domain
MSTRSPDPIDIQVGQRIRIERTARRISQEGLASRIGVTLQQVQKYEKGLNRVGAGRLTRIAMALGIPVSTFFSEINAEGFSDGREEGSPLELLTHPGVFRLLRAYAELPDTSLRSSFIALMERVADRLEQRAKSRSSVSSKARNIRTSR